MPLLKKQTLIGATGCRCCNTDAARHWRAVTGAADVYWIGPRAERRDSRGQMNRATPSLRTAADRVIWAIVVLLLHSRPTNVVRSGER